MKIDKIIGDHLAKKGFAYSDELWSDMDKLIQQNRKDKLRRRMPILLGTGLFIIAGLALYFSDFYSGGINKKQSTVSSVKNANSLSQYAGNTARKAPVEIQHSRHSASLFSVNNQSHKNEVNNEIVVVNNNIPLFETTEFAKTTYQNLADNSVKTSPPEILITPDEKSMSHTNSGAIDIKSDSTPLIATPVIATPTEVNPEIKPDSVINTDTKNKYPRPRLPWIAYIDASIAYNSKFSSVTSKLFNTDLMQEKPGNIKSAGIGITLNKSFYTLGTGIQFTEFASQNTYATAVMNWKYQYYYKMVNPNYKISTTGNTIALIQKVKDSSGTAHTVSLYQNTPSYFQYVSIPINLGVQKNFGRLFCRAEAGLSASFLVGKGGYYSIADENGKVKVVNLSGYNKLNSTVFANQFTFSLGYSLNRHWIISAKASINQTRSSLFSTFHENLGYTLFHLGVGGRF